MTSYVVDTSALLRHFLGDGPLDERVGEALDGAANGLVRVVVPELLWAEVTNVLLRRERSGSIAPEEVRALIDVLQSLPITTFGHGPLVHRARLRDLAKE